MTSPDRLPPLLVGRRRPLMGRLVAASIAQAVLAMGLAVLVGLLIEADPRSVSWIGGGLLAALAGTAASTYGVRVLAEQLGQDYVHELRGLLVGDALTPGGRASLGITLARTTNDLTGVRGWVTQGIAPMVAAVPLVLVGLGVLAGLEPVLAVAAAAPLVVMALLSAVIVPEAYRRARHLRRLRGRLANRLTDTLHARDGIVSAGGTERERRRLRGASREVAHAAVHRARSAALLQALAATTAGSIAVLVVVVGLRTGVGAGVLATALVVAGALAAPLAETGRIVELRQNFRAARRVLVRHVQGPREELVRPQTRGPMPGARGRLLVEGLCSARAGDVLRLEADDPAVASQALRALSRPGERRVIVSGWDLARVPDRRRRELLGLAASGIPLERGPLGRAVRYRLPDSAAEVQRRALEQTGLGDLYDGLERGERTVLRRGGEPLPPSVVARVKLARALLGRPPLLLLDGIDADLDPEGRRLLRGIVDDYPGVVVFVSDVPERMATDHRVVRVEPEPAEGSLAGSVRA